MRLVVDSLIAVMLVMLLAAVVWAHRTDRQRIATHDRVYESLAALHEQAVYHGALGDTELSDTGFPKQVSPDWFGADLPYNYLAEGDRPWIDVAPPGDYADNPPDPVIGDLDQAGFWYNPNRGIFRARVPAMESDAQTLALYNRLNNAELGELPRQIDEARQPLAHRPLPAATARAVVLEEPEPAVAESADDSTPRPSLRRTLRQD